MQIKVCLGKIATSTWVELKIWERPTIRPRLAILSQVEGSSSTEICCASSSVEQCWWARRPQGSWWFDGQPDLLIHHLRKCEHHVLLPSQRCWKWDGHNLLGPMLKDRGKALVGQFLGHLSQWKLDLRGLWEGSLARQEEESEAWATHRVRGNRNRQQVRPCPGFTLALLGRLPSLFLLQ